MSATPLHCGLWESLLAIGDFVFVLSLCQVMGQNSWPGSMSADCVHVKNEYDLLVVYTTVVSSWGCICPCRCVCMCIYLSVCFWLHRVDELYAFFIQWSPNVETDAESFVVVNKNASGHASESSVTEPRLLRSASISKDWEVPGQLCLSLGG